MSVGGKRKINNTNIFQYLSFNYHFGAMPCENELACEYTRQTITHSRLCRDSPPMMLTFN